MIILKYECSGVFKYSSFLDTRNAFQRTLNRCKVKINMSQGFNPHELVYYLDPDSLGIELKTNYVMIDSDCQIDDLIEKFNLNAPTGLLATKIAKIENKINFNTTFKYAKYIIKSVSKINGNILNDIINQTNILADKDKNGEIVQIDIKPKIFSIELIDEFTFSIIITYGQEKLSPYLLIDYLCNKLNIEKNDCDIIKTNIYIVDNQKLVDADTIFFNK